MESHVCLTDIAEKILSHINAATLDKRVIEALYVDGSFLGREHSLWDYKETFDPKLDANQFASAKLIRSIVAFHNTYGGYLIFGIKSLENDTKFEPVGVNGLTPAIPTLKQKIRSYTNTDINITYREVDTPIADKSYTFGVMHIPKRINGDPVVVFAKDSPRQDRHHLFCEKETYWRYNENNKVAATGDDWNFLHSPRIYPSQTDHAHEYTQNRSTLSHNLPDKNKICPFFVGRAEITKSLYQWLNDDFTQVIALVGEGGRGKTSIAYNFASEIVSSGAGSFSSLIWLTAKEKQFSGLQGEYLDMQDTHYSSPDTLLQALCKELALKDSELADLSTLQLKKQAKDALRVMPSFVVVDDVDSLDAEPQKQVLTLLPQIVSAGSKILVTTRSNYSYPNDQCITVGGLPEDQYGEYLQSLSNRFHVKFSKSEIEQLFNSTEGSPLLTESIIRLVRLGESVGQAIKSWKGKAGEDARSAAISKELDRLSLESKRVLLIASMLGSASLAELRIFSKYGQQAVQDCIAELQGLFLLPSPRLLRSEPRFEISGPIRTTVLENKTRMAVDHEAIRLDIKKAKSKIKPGNHGKNNIGIVINQARAMLKEGDTDGATQTVKHALKGYSENPDLLLMLAVCYESHKPPLLTEARNTCREAYDNGQRKELLFQHWFNVEMLANHYIGAVWVANTALEEDIGKNEDWAFSHAVALTKMAEQKVRDRDKHGALRDYETAATELAKSIAGSHGATSMERIRFSCANHDAMWNVATTLGPKERWDAAFSLCEEAIKRRDFRASNYFRMLDALDNWLINMGRPAPGSSAEKRAVTRISLAKELLNARSTDPKASYWYHRVRNRFEDIQNKYAKLTTKK